MERALAAIHQANRERLPASLEYGCRDGQVGVFFRVSESIEELVTGSIAASYPNCRVAAVESEQGSNCGWDTWSAELALVPELFPILRHAQFEDVLNGTLPIRLTGYSRRSCRMKMCGVELKSPSHLPAPGDVTLQRSP